MWQKALFAWMYIPWFPKSHFTLDRYGKGAAGDPAELKAKPVSSFCSLVELGPAQHQTNSSPLVHGVWDPHVWEPRG